MFTRLAQSVGVLLASAAAASALTAMPGDTFVARYDFSADPVMPPFNSVSLVVDFNDDNALDAGEGIAFALTDSRGQRISVIDFPFPGSPSKNFSTGRPLDRQTMDPRGSIRIAVPDNSAYEIISLGLSFGFFDGMDSDFTERQELVGAFTRIGDDNGMGNGGGGAGNGDGGDDPVMGGGGGTDPSVVPIPATLPLVLSGLAGLGWIGRRSRKEA